MWRSSALIQGNSSAVYSISRSTIISKRRQYMNVVLPSLHKCRPIKYPIQFQTSRFIRTEQPHSHIHADDFASMLEHSSKI